MSSQQYKFAVEVVRTLRAAGYESLWAGGCVRDQLLERQPKDYDVATNATPEQIREVFGKRRTLPIGQSFGVITVLGPETAIEVATFRQDAEYSDGRHPDSVTFSTAEEDAQRRDFTINGLFYDPLEDRVIDYVGGRDDLQRQTVRAIGDPYQRIAEDKLRMLRAVRFAATFDFFLDVDTEAAVRNQSKQICVVSAERIAAELRRMLAHPNRAQAVGLLGNTELLPAILPEAWATFQSEGVWEQTIEMLERLSQERFSIAFAVLLRSVDNSKKAVSAICRRLKLANDERQDVEFLLAHEADVRSARTIAWPRLQRILIQTRAKTLLDYAEPVAQVLDGGTAEIDFCREKLALPQEQLNPSPLLSGDDLKANDIPPGPAYKRILDQVRNAQLDQEIHSRDEALEMALRLFQSAS